MDGFLFSIFLFALMAITIPALVLYAIYRAFVAMNLKRVGVAIVIAITSFLCYEVYTAIYPTDSFYFEEYKTITLREPPKSAVVIKKTASYPDFKGEYASAALIRLSRTDYANLLNDLSKDKRLQEVLQVSGSQEYNEVTSFLKNNDVSRGFTREQKGEEDRYYYIGFMDDGCTIVSYIVVS